jgi:hypothetical protein
LVCAPLHLVAAWLASGGRSAEPTTPAAPGVAPSRAGDGTLLATLAVAVSTIGFVTWGFAIVVVELLHARGGLDVAQAAALAALVGVAQVAARLAEFVFAPRVAATRMALCAATVFPLSLLALLAAPGPAGALVFVILFGAASGTMSVARATLPLELFGPERYGPFAAKLALPMNLAFAAAPLAFGGLLEAAGPAAPIMVALAASLLALAALARLARAAA